MPIEPVTASLLASGGGMLLDGITNFIFGTMNYKNQKEQQEYEREMYEREFLEDTRRYNEQFALKKLALRQNMTLAQANELRQSVLFGSKMGEMGEAKRQRDAMARAFTEGYTNGFMG